MKKALVSTLVAGALALVAIPAAAQTSANANITASATVLGNLTISGANGMNFGFVVPTVTTTKAVDPVNDGTNAGRWDIAGSPNAEISVTFTLPDSLRLGGTGTGAANAFPISFAAGDAAWADLAANQTSATTFDPTAAGTLNISAAGALFVWLGGTIDASAFNGTVGAYSETVNLAIAYTGN